MADALAGNIPTSEDEWVWTALVDLIPQVNRGASREESFGLVAGALRDVFQIDRFAVVLVQPDGSLGITASEGLSESYLQVARAHLAESAGARALELRRPIYIENAQVDPAFHPFERAAQQEGFYTVLIWPMFAAQEPLGYLIMYHNDIRTYTPAEIVLAQALVQQAAFAVEHGRLRSQADHRLADLETSFRQRVAEAEAIDDILLRISASLDLESTLQFIVDSAARLSDSHTSSIYLQDELGDFRARASFGISLERLQQVTLTGTTGLLATMSRTGEPMQVTNFIDQVATSTDVQDVVAGTGIHATLGVPMMEDTRCVGALYVGSRSRSEYAPDTVRTLQRLCAFAHVALQNARRYADLAAERTRLQAYLDAIPQGIGIFSRLGSVALLNHAMLELTGLESAPSPLTRDDVLNAPRRIAGRAMNFGFDPAAVFERVLSGGVAEQGLVELDNPRQTYAMHFSALRDIGGAVTGVVLTTRDITSPLELERERARSALLAQLLDLSGWLNSNQQVGALTERVVEAARDLVGANAASLGLIEGEYLIFHRYRLPDGWSDLEVKLAPGQGVPGVVWATQSPYISNHAESDERVVTTIQKRYAFHKLAYVPVINREGKFIGALGVYDPVDDRDFGHSDTEALQLLAHQAAIAIENARLNEIRDEFLSIVSHELKTPVTSIKGFTQVLQRRTPPETLEKTGRYLDVIDHQADRLASLINDLLDLSRVRTGKFMFEVETFDYSRLVMDTVAEIQLISPTNSIRLDTTAPTWVTGNAERLRQVLTNLLNNAITHGPTNGPVTVTVALAEQTVTTTVADEGPGLQPGDHEAIFAPYFQIRHSRSRYGRGLGIGLYISRRIVEEHGGAIWVESGQPTLFRFSLPAARPPDG